MDKVVDHLLVFKGNGLIKDFPGNYTQYREWNALQSEANATKETSKKPETNANPTSREQNQRTGSRKMTYKEKREFEQLGKEIEELEKTQKALENELCGNTVSVERINFVSKTLQQVKDDLDEKSMRWLELSEIES